ncbi:MAG: hydroxymethylglutaryl-CoA lyase [Bacteroidota bacterium]|nr:hydroxymethylglutaryl-CoA lyase [Bacteroidota bacterium]
MKIIECPRDAMQGVATFIPTKIKIEYINQLLNVGFDTLDCGSFVSPKAVPQMQDSAAVLEGLNFEDTYTKILIIVGNIRGAREASLFPNISYLGYPFSLSETFQKRNTNQSIKEAFDTALSIQNICMINGMDMVCYLSMGFGNPYGDPYDEEKVFEWVEKLMTAGIKIFSLSDTVGTASVAQVYQLYQNVTSRFPGIELGVHLHSTVEKAADKVEAAFFAGCRRFDGAMNGYGGCPMADDKLVGNTPTETIIHVLEGKGIDLDLDHQVLIDSLATAKSIFSTYK